MAKLKPSKSKKARQEVYKKESRSQKNRDTKLKRQIKKLEKLVVKQEARGLDVENIQKDISRLKNLVARAKPAKNKSMGKNTTQQNRDKFYVDVSGKTVGAPSFSVFTRFNRKTGRTEEDRTVGADWYKANQGQCK